MSTSKTDTISSKAINEDTNSITAYGIGFDEDNKACFSKHLLKQLHTIFPTLKIRNEIPDQSDLLIINLDKANAVPLLSQTLPSDDSFVIIIAHEVTRMTLPFLKLANHVIFINELQKYVCEDFLSMDCTSSVLAYPFGENMIRQTQKDGCFIYFEGDNFLLDDVHYEEQIKLAFQWYQYNHINHYYFLFEVHPTAKDRFEEFKIKISKTDARIKLLNAYDLSVQNIYEFLGKSFCGQVFKQEITLDQYVEALENRQSWILHDTLAESPILAAIQHAALLTNNLPGKTFYNFNNQNQSTWAEWHNEIKKITQYKPQKINPPVLDKLEDLNIIAGQPLKNDFVFSVCFRNQEDKIIRCLQSIRDQNGPFDFGIVIVSDQSTDRSVELILDFIKNSKLDICIVDNKDRKFASGNFYNVAHHLVSNDESVIIEIDGDDFLANREVLSILNGYYKNGALKTNGSYNMHPEDQTIIPQTEIEFNHNNFDVSNPWSLNCTTWLPLRSVKRHLLCKVELKYFLERKSKRWLSDNHDISVQPRLIELAKNKAVFVKEVLYSYDMSGEFHDNNTESYEEKILDSYRKLHKIYHPISTH